MSSVRCRVNSDRGHEKGTPNGTMERIEMPVRNQSILDLPRGRQDRPNGSGSPRRSAGHTAVEPLPAPGVLRVAVFDFESDFISNPGAGPERRLSREYCLAAAACRGGSRSDWPVKWTRCAGIFRAGFARAGGERESPDERCRPGDRGRRPARNPPGGVPGHRQPSPSGFPVGCAARFRSLRPR